MGNYYTGMTLGNRYLMHHGIHGMKWYVRRYQNSDGTLTEEGKKRYSQFRENASRSWNRSEDIGNHKKPSKDIQNKLKNVVDSAYNDSKHKDYIRERDEAIKTRNKHTLSSLISPNNKYDAAVRNANSKAVEAYDIFQKNASLSLMDAIERMPKSQRDAAYDFAYSLMGWDW